MAVRCLLAEVVGEMVVQALHFRAALEDLLSWIFKFSIYDIPAKFVLDRYVRFESLKFLFSKLRGL